MGTFQSHRRGSGRGRRSPLPPKCSESTALDHTVGRMDLPLPPLAYKWPGYEILSVWSVWSQHPRKGLPGEKSMKGAISSPGTKIGREAPYLYLAWGVEREGSLPEDCIAGSGRQRALQAGISLTLHPCLWLEGIGTALGQKGENGRGPGRCQRSCPLRSVAGPEP